MAATKLTIIIPENKVNHQDEAHILCNDVKSLNNLFDDYVCPDNNSVIVKTRMSLISLKRLIADLE